MSELSDALDELMDVNDEVTGTPQSVIIGGKNRRAIIEEIGTDEAILSGGTTEIGSYRVKLRKSDFSQEPEKGDCIQVRKKELEVLSLIERNGVEYELTCGRLVAEDA